MTDPDKAVATQLANIEKRSGKSLNELCQILKATGLVKHGELLAHLKQTLAMGHGDANAMVHYYSAQANPAPASETDAEDPLDAIYTGPKAALRPIHEAFMQIVDGWGEFERAPKKTYISLRRKKQFAMLGPASQTRVELGLNMKGVPGTERLLEQAAGGMCQYKVKISAVSEIDAELMAWVRIAFDSAA
jgi:Domain of unknown function (DUF5655)/Domain of unknown function (DUF4287)